MAFFKFRARGPQANEGRAAAAAVPAESVEAMRRRARHRLLGAGVLVLAGVVGFPMLFDTQPRPIAVDIPIEIPDRNKVPPLALPTPAPAAAATAGSSHADNKAPGPTQVARAGGVITETADGDEVHAPSMPLADAPGAQHSEPVVSAPPPHTPEPKPEPRPEPKPKPEPKPEPKPTPKPEAKPAATDDGARARALLDGRTAAAAAAKPAAVDEAGRFVVQVGAFADAEKAREVRSRLERAGLKTYTHVAKTADGERTRVRIGPFSTRAEAEKAAAQAKGLALAAAVLTL